MIAFFDASALIYLIDGAEPFAGRVRSELARIARKHPKMGAAASRLSWLECRVRPARNNELATLAAFDAFFSRPDLVWVELGKDVVELATAIRVKHGLRTPDALQAASCLQLDAIFLTGDTAFKKGCWLECEGADLNQSSRPACGGKAMLRVPSIPRSPACLKRGAGIRLSLCQQHCDNLSLAYFPS